MTETANPYPAPAPSSGGIGIASLVTAIVIVLIGLGIQVFSTYVVPGLVGSGMSILEISTVFTVGSIVTALLSLVAIATGAVGIRPGNDRGRLAAAAGLAIGGSTLLGVLVTLGGSLAQMSLR